MMQDVVGPASPVTSVATAEEGLLVSLNERGRVDLDYIAALYGRDRDAILAELDMVVASVHSAFNQSREAMTARLLRAIENPYVNVIGHPTGRNVETFAGYDFDHDAVFAAAARTGTALEIDGQPSRLDLPSPLARSPLPASRNTSRARTARASGWLPSTAAPT